MKITLVSTFPKKGDKHINGSGVASYAKNLIANFALAPDDKVTVIAEKINRRYERYTDGMVDVERIFDRNLKCMWQIFVKLARTPRQVVHIQHEVSLFGPIINTYLLQLGMLLIRKHRYVVTLHYAISPKEITKEFVRLNRSHLPTVITKFAFRLIFVSFSTISDVIIVHEHYFKKILIENYRANRQNIKVIPHGVEDLKNVPIKDAKIKLGIPQDKSVILFMGYLAGYKGLDLLLDGYSKLSYMNKSTYLIIGAGPHPKFKTNKKYTRYYNSLRERASKIIPEDSYRWTGFIPEQEITTYYSASDLTIFPYSIAMSSSGPMSLSMGYKKPFLASDAFTNILDKDILFKKDGEELARKVISFLKQDGKYTALLMSLREERLWPKISARTYDIYSEQNERIKK